MATDEYARIIKEEMESVDDENNRHHSEEKFGIFEKDISENEFELVQIKSEDISNFVYHDLKTEEVMEEVKVKKDSLCEMCRLDSFSATDFTPEGCIYCGKCPYQNEANTKDPLLLANTMQDEYMALSFGTDPGISRFVKQEEVVVVKKEKAPVENLSPTLYQNKFGDEKNDIAKLEIINTTEEINELNNYKVRLKPIGESIIHEQNRICPKNANGNSESTFLKKHEQINDKKKVYCEICSKSFMYKSGVIRHLRTHTGEKPFNCKICSKSFTRRDILYLHEAHHTVENAFKCNICSKSFTRMSHLKSHEAIHTGVKPFNCKICLKSFNRMSNLKTHQKIHTGEKAFNCKICSKSFTRMSHLKSHEAIHTGERPFICKNCSKSFKQMSHLKTHQSVHAGGKPFNCKICSKSFSRKSVLKKHKERSCKKTI